MPVDTSLHKAANSGDLASIQILFDEPADPDVPVDVNIAGASERRPIHRAAGANHVDIIKYLIQKGATIDILDKSQRTALHWAAISGHVQAGKALIEAGANLFAVTSTKATALHSACESGWVEFVDFIIAAAGERKTELFTSCDADGKRPLELAVAGKHSSVVARLRSSGDPNATSAACSIS
mmetsp:Transcript_59238/g.118876  ORF Transcript_59238/g.118876 Transcript_59238/m.118876 type:complete len:182 (+) Transcript_59238:283-828(+)